jgi:hypothetical protein
LINYIRQKIETLDVKNIIDFIVKATKYDEYLKKEFGEEDAKERFANI